MFVIYNKSIIANFWDIIKKFHNFKIELKNAFIIVINLRRRQIKKFT